MVSALDRNAGMELERSIYYVLALFAAFWCCLVIQQHGPYTLGFAQSKSKATTLSPGEDLLVRTWPMEVTDHASESTTGLTMERFVAAATDPLGQEIASIVQHKHYPLLPIFVADSDLIHYWLTGKSSEKPIDRWVAFATNYLQAMDLESQDSSEDFCLGQETEADWAAIIAWTRMHPHQHTFIVPQ